MFGKQIRATVARAEEGWRSGETECLNATGVRRSRQRVRGAWHSL